MKAKKILVRVFSIAIALLLMLNVGGITARAEKRDTIVVWTWGGQYATAAHEAAQIYRNLNPNVNVEIQEIPIEDYYTKLTLELENGSGPDVAIMHDDKIASYDAYTKLGVRYTTQPAALYYNKSVMEEMGVDSAELENNLTWDRFREIGQILKDRHPNKYLFPNDGTIMETLRLSAGIMDLESMTPDELQIMTEALQMLKVFCDDHLIYEGPDPIVDMLHAGAFVSVIGGPWWVPTISEIANEKGQEWRVAKIPKSDIFSNIFSKDVCFGGNSWMAFENSNEAIAVNFLAGTFQTNTQLSVMMAEQNFVPVLPSVLPDLINFPAEPYFSGSDPSLYDQNGQHVIEFLFNILPDRRVSFCNHIHGGSGIRCACTGFAEEAGGSEVENSNLTQEAREFLNQLLQEVLLGNITPEEAIARLVEWLRENGYGEF